MKGHKHLKLFKFCMASPLCNIGLTIVSSLGNVAKGHINLQNILKICSLFYLNATDIAGNIFAIFGQILTYNGNKWI